MASIYILKNKINNKCYVGQTTKSTQCRITQHIWWAKNGGTLLIHKAIKKYGFENFELNTIECCSDDLDRIEKMYIIELNTISPNGYNLTTGGYTYRFSEETKQKLSRASTGRKHSEETRKKLSESHKGKKHSEETKIKMGLKSKGNKRCLGKKRSKEAIEKTRRATTGKKRSEEVKKLLSEQKLGSKNPMYGLIGGSHPNSKKIIMIHPSGIEEYFDSLMDACRKYKLDVRNVSAVLVGKRHHHKGYKFKYTAELLQDKTIG